MTAVRCQRWNEQLPLWQPGDVDGRFQPRSYTVAEIAHKPAREFVLTHHYSGSFPSATVCYGLVRGGSLVGVAVYSMPTQSAVLTNALPELRPNSESLELGRFVLLDPEPGNAESWFLARCHEQLLARGVVGVVSFSDPVPRTLADGRQVSPGHVGIIYQATNARYTGRSTAGIEWVLQDGVIVTRRAVQKVRSRDQGHGYVERLLTDRGAAPLQDGDDPKLWLTAALDAAGARAVRHAGKHRYVFQLGATARARAQVRVALPALPYPKQPDLPTC